MASKHTPLAPGPVTRVRPRPAPRATRSRRLGVVAAVAVALSAGALAACSSTTVPSDPTLAKGQEVYAKSCAACHGSDGGGVTGPRLIGVEARLTEEQEIAKITDGVSGTAMPAWGGRLSPEEIAAVAAYTRSLSAGS